MPLAPMSRLLSHAQQHHYAVGYFESWNLESLLAVADAAEAMRSPVMLGFSGIQWSDGDLDQLPIMPQRRKQRGEGMVVQCFFWTQRT